MNQFGMNIPSLSSLNGLQIMEAPHLTKRMLKRMCRSKRKRIIKKWLKNPKNYWQGPDPAVYIIKKPKFSPFSIAPTTYMEEEKVLICHPKIYKIIMRAIDNQK